MLQVKITDLYNTRYFYKSFVADLHYLFNAIIRLREDSTFTPNVGNDLLNTVYEAVKTGESVVLDLADAQLTTDACTAVLTAMRKGILFCDSLDVNRDDILKTNIERLNTIKEDFVPLPLFSYRTDLKEYIKSLDSNVKYSVVGMTEPVMIALTCLITLMRPSITLDIDLISNKLFKFIATKVSVKTLTDDTAFFFITDEGMAEYDTPNIYVQSLSETVPVREAVKYGIIIPKKFGRDVLLQNAEWRPLFKACLTILEDYQEDCPKRLSEIYGVNL